MSEQLYKSNNPEQLQQDLLNQEWALLCAIHEKEVQASELKDELIRFRHIKDTYGLN